MDSTMMDHALSTQMIFERGERLFAESRIVSFDGVQTRVTDYAQTASRARCLASALAELGLRPGELLGTYCWNTPAHLEAYLAVPAMGCVLHTLNVRLPAPQLEYIIDHAGDRILLVDAVLLPGLIAMLPGLSQVQHIIVIGDWSGPIEGFAGKVHDYETLIAAHDPVKEWPRVEETNAAAVCYTSGTTGLPKGVVYSHRSVFLHSLASMAADCFAISNHDRILMVPPMFHANAWGMPFSGWLAGSDMILPGQFLQPAHLASLIESERPTLMAAVPTILNDLLQQHGRSPIDLSCFRTIVCGGSAVSPALIERVKSSWGVDVVQGWGMTETSPMCVLSFPPRGTREEEAAHWRAKSGRPVPGMQVRIVDGSGNSLPEDGKTVGQLQLRGPWVASGYLREAPGESPLSSDGWLRTGDVGRIDPHGFVEVTDREKDLIKSGGEWISSVELENGIARLPGVSEVSVIAVPDERWEERPLAVIVMEPGASANFAEMRAALLCNFARFMIPENWSVLEAIPKTSVGKLDKKAIKEKFGEGGLNVVIETRFGSGELD